MQTYADFRAGTDRVASENEGVLSRIEAKPECGYEA